MHFPRRRMIASRTRSAGFTLVELLVVIAILALLMALLAPSLRRARTLTRRAVDASNTSQLLQTFQSYAASGEGWYPYANRETNAGTDIGRGHDDMVAFRYSTWLVLRDRYGWTNERIACTSYHDTIWMDWFTNWGSTYGGTVLGRMVWTGRSDTFYSYTPYTTPKRVGDRGTSNTAMTCLAWVRAPTWNAGLVPHLAGDEWGRTPNGISDPYDFTPMPEGMVVGYTHGAARWVQWSGLLAVRNHNWLYYDPEY